MRTTYMAKPNEVERKWYIVDAEGKTLGRLASEVAALIRGKHKPQFTPHVDTGISWLLSTPRKSTSPAKRWRTRNTIVTPCIQVD